MSGASHQPGNIASPAFLHRNFILRCGNFELSLDRPLIMGIVNLTPDSFSGDGLACNTQRAIEHARAQIAAGADLLDLGAESSRPGVQPTSLADELKRLLPVLEGLADCGVPISVDTYKPEVMCAAIEKGASMINDIYALRWPGAVDAVRESNCAVCLMHMQGEPLNMQHDPVYADVVAEVRTFLAQSARQAIASGIARDRLLLDPGFCFGKTLEHNLKLLRHLDEISGDGLPLLVGVSRKSMLGAITGRAVEKRLATSVSAAFFAAQHGAGILRVHDVAETRDALMLWQAMASLA